MQTNYVINRIQETDDDYLQHYGVLGMKWGIRKANRTGGTYTYKSHSTKKWDKKSQRLTRKAQSQAEKGKTEKAVKTYNKAERASKISAKSATHDSKMQAYAAKAKTGNVIAANILGGAWANKTYASIQASGGSKPTGLVMSALNSLAELGPITAAVGKSIYIRNIDD